MQKIPLKLTGAIAVMFALATPQVIAQSFNRDKLAFVVSNVFGAT